MRNKILDKMNSITNWIICLGINAMLTLVVSVKYWISEGKDDIE